MIRATNGAERRNEAPKAEVLGVEQTADHHRVVERSQDPLAVGGKHIGGGHVGVHPPGHHHRESQRAVQREQPVQPLSREQEPCARHQQSIECDHRWHGVRRAHGLPKFEPHRGAKRSRKLVDRHDLRHADSLAHALPHGEYQTSGNGQQPRRRSVASCRPGRGCSDRD